MVNIFLKPKEIKTMINAFVGEKAFSLSSSFDIQNEGVLAEIPIDSTGTPLMINMDSTLNKEEYRLTVNRYDVSVLVSSEAGLRLAMITLKQMLKSDVIPCMEIHDYPDFEVRGVMIDVQIEIPKPETLKKLIDLLSDLKYNQLQLSFEGLVFTYTGFENEWKDNNLITPEYLYEIREHCKKRGMELVPLQNGFGHMKPWLAIPRLRHLAECENGYDRNIFGITIHYEPGTLNPLDEKSFEFAKQLYQDILPHFESDLLFVGGDECLELGEGKSAEAVKKFGKEKVWVDYILKLYNMCQEFGKTMMVWDDMIIKNPELLDLLPKDLIVVDWAYEMYPPFEKNCAVFHNKGINFYVAPSTCTWNSYVGRSEKMRENQLSAAKNGKKFGASGYLLTDWGGAQFPITTYVPFAYGAGLCWNLEGNEHINLALEYLDNNLFDCRGFAEFVYDCGNAVLHEAYGNPDHCMLIAVHYMLTLIDTHTLENQDVKSYKEMIGFLANQLKKISDFDTADEFKNEMSLNLRMLKNIAEVAIIILGDVISDSEFENLLTDIKKIKSEYIALWKTKNYEYNPINNDSYNYVEKLDMVLRELPDIRAGKK